MPRMNKNIHLPKRPFFFFWGILLCSLLQTACISKEEAPQPYNVLFIAIDDLNDWTGFLGGHPQALTPNLDRLAQQSLIFERAYCAVPACNPSRVAIMTGMHAHTTGIYRNHHYMWDSPVIQDQATTLPKYFGQHGYYTAAKGKLFHGQRNKWAEADQWENYLLPNGDMMENHPEKSDTQLACGMPASQPRHQNFDWGTLEGVKVEETNDYSTAQFIAEELSKEHQRPFFLGAGLFRPHMPWYLPPGYLEQFPLENIQLPLIEEEDLNDIPPIGKEISQGLKPQSDYQRLKQYGKMKEAVRAYLASIKYADDCLGQILDALEASPYWERTIVVLWGDHGWHFGEKLHYRKFALWEESNRVPLLIRVPGSKSQGVRCERVVSLVDLYPTLTDLCGLPSNPSNQGQSLLPLLENPAAKWDKPALSTMGYMRHTLRSEQYRYIRYEDGAEELYDHEEDPQEWKNLAGQEEYSTLLTQFRNRLPKINYPKPGT